jgi:hypothetical protein
MKNWKLSRTITSGITVIVIIGISLLYVIKNKTMNNMLKQSERNLMQEPVMPVKALPLITKHISFHLLAIIICAVTTRFVKPPIFELCGLTVYIKC